MKKLLFRILVGVVVLVIAAVVCRNFIAQKAVEIGVKEVTGFPLQIGSVQVGLFSGQLDVHDLKLMNPPEFADARFVDLPLFHVQYELGSLLRLSPHVKEIVVKINEVVIVKNAAGQSNANTIQEKLAPAASSPAQPAAKPAESTKKISYQVDRLQVHIGTVVMKDFSKGGQPTERKITLNRDVTFENISESTSVSAMVMKVVFGQLGDVAGGLIKGGSAAVKDAGQTLQKTGKSLFDNLKKATHSTD